ncbi:hypothetical protein D3C72_1015280 [compost metagenome]
MFDETKSNRSNIFKLNSLKSARALLLSAHTEPSTASSNMVTTVALVRVQPKRSWKITTGTSISDSIAPVAATAARIKNTTIRTCPMGICENTAGIVMNTSDGPALGAKPNVNTAGKMAMPASMDTPRSAAITRKVVTGIFWSSRK